MDDTTSNDGAGSSPTAAAALDLARAVRRDPEDPARWVRLGKAGGASIYETQFTPAMCFVKAIKVSEKKKNSGESRTEDEKEVEAEAWSHLGDSIMSSRSRNRGGLNSSNSSSSSSSSTTEQTVSVNGKNVSATECVLNALRLKSMVPKYWVQFGVLGGGTLHRVQYNAQQCYVRALNLNPKYVEGWIHLGDEAGGIVAGRRYDMIESYHAAVNLDPSNWKAWLALGDTLVLARDDNARMCFENVAALAPGEVDGWAELVFFGGGTVDNRAVSRRECAERALSLDATRSSIWAALGDEVKGGIVNGTHYTRRECYEKALLHDGPYPNDLGNAIKAFVWVKLGELGGASLHRHHYGVRECARMALSSDATNAEAWRLLGDAGGGYDSTGRYYRRQRCYERAIELDPSDPVHADKTWYILSQRGGANISGHFYSAKQCLEFSLAIRRANGQAWTALAAMGGGTVNRRVYSKRQCYVKAAKFDPQSADNWLRLADAKGGYINKTHFSSADCLQRARAIAPLHVWARRTFTLWHIAPVLLLAAAIVVTVASMFVRRRSGLPTLPLRLRRSRNQSQNNRTNRTRLSSKSREKGRCFDAETGNDAFFIV